MVPLWLSHITRLSQTTFVLHMCCEYRYAITPAVGLCNCCILLAMSSCCRCYPSRWWWTISVVFVLKIVKLTGDPMHDICKTRYAAIVMVQHCVTFQQVQMRLQAVARVKSMHCHVVQGGKAKLSMHMGELVEGDFTHKSENTQPKKQSPNKKVPFQLLLILCLCRQFSLCTIPLVLAMQM